MYTSSVQVSKPFTQGEKIRGLRRGSIRTLEKEIIAMSFNISGRKFDMRPHQKSPHYSLWLMPSGEVRQRLAEMILDLSREYATLPFAPHVTLAGGIVGPAREVASKMRDLARRISPFTVRLTTVDGLEEYFRCLFVRVAKTYPIMKANEAAREVFRLAPQPAFMPHLSLLYGHLPSSVKDRIVASLGGRFQLEFKISSLHLYLIKNAPQAWRRLASFGLGL
jgi:2'-5' RNA ligase